MAAKLTRKLWSACWGRSKAATQPLPAPAAPAAEDDDSHFEGWDFLFAAAAGSEQTTQTAVVASTPCFKPALSTISEGVEARSAAVSAASPLTASSAACTAISGATLVACAGDMMLHGTSMAADAPRQVTTPDLAAPAAAAALLSDTTNSDGSATGTVHV